MDKYISIYSFLWKTCSWKTHFLKEFCRVFLFSDHYTLDGLNLSESPLENLLFFLVLQKILMKSAFADFLFEM